MLKELVAKFFRDSDAEEIELPENTLKQALDLYFERRPPFGEGKKKSEFPDAFVLEALKSKAGRNSESVYAISEDPDFVAACKEHPHLEQLPSIGHFLDLWNVHTDSVKQVRSTLRRNVKKIHEELDRIVEGISGEMDASGSVAMSHRKIVDILDELVISCDETKASVEFVCFVEFEAWLEIRHADGVSLEHRRGEREQAISITLDFRFDPKDPTIFEIETYWAPQTVTFTAHRAV